MAGSRVKTIVVVNDDRAFLGLTRILLEHEGYRVVICDEPARGHAVIKAATPDLAVIDVRMPGAPDWHVLEALKADPATAGTPALVCTGVTIGRATVARLRRRGLAVLPKPFRLDELLGAIRRLIG